MIQRIDLTGTSLSASALTSTLPRPDVDVDAALETVRPIIEDVRTRGHEALMDLAERFDGVRPPHLRVPQSSIDAALAELEPAVRHALEVAIERVCTVHRAQLPREHSTELSPGACVRQRWIPVQRVGLYVPGGLAVYPSSVVMNVVAAQEAGVPSLAVASPPQKAFAGEPHPTILAACALLGVTEVYAVGGAQAIGLLAYGMDDLGDGEPSRCEPVDVITGPGNVWVAAAKRLVMGKVGIDAEAGPTEIAILADETASVDAVIADLISQAEHDPLAASILVTDSSALADDVVAALPASVARTKHRERVTQALSGPQSGVVLVDDLEVGLAVVDAYGAEHLEIHTRNARDLADRVHNAGAIFVGTHAPVSLGDYVAGSNHVLPTGGTAAFASGLNVHAFLKSVQVIEYDERALAELASEVVVLAESEDLPAHGDAVKARFSEK